MIQSIMGIPSIEPKLLCSFQVFPFKLLLKINFNRFKRKNPALWCWVLFVTLSGLFHDPSHFGHSKHRTQTALQFSGFSF